MQHLVACFDAVLVCDASENLEEYLVNVVDRTVVPYPDSAQYEVNSSLVKSVALGVRLVIVVCYKCALPTGIWYKAARLLRAHHEPPENVAEDLFNKILTRFAIQAKGPDGKWTRKPLAYRESNNVHLLIARPPEICVNLVFKHIHAASSYTIC